MGIRTLNNYLQENGREMLIELLLSEKTIITEKINAHRVSILKDRLNNIEFYTKKKTSRIKTIDRIISDLYDPFIQHIIKEKDNLPQGTYSFYYVKHDLNVNYTKKPRNFLLLTDMALSNSDKMAKKDIPSLDKIATNINVSSQNIIYEGTLMKRKHIKHIVDYIENGGCLPEIMTNIFGDTATTLSKNPSDIIEGYIFKIGDTLYKLEDNRFERKSFPKVNMNGYEMLVIELHEFIRSLNMTDIKVQEKNSDLKYANFMCEIFNKYIDYWGEDIEQHLLTPPPFMEMTGALGKRYISNKKTLSNLKSDKYEYLLRVFLSSFYKPISERGLFDADFVKEHTQLCKNIKDYLALKSGILDFQQFKRFGTYK